MHKNSEGYSDPTAGKAMTQASRMPPKIWEVYEKLNGVASLHGLVITGIRDKRTGKEWRR